MNRTHLRGIVYVIVGLMAVVAAPAAVWACVPSDVGMIATVPVDVTDELPGGG